MARGGKGLGWVPTATAGLCLLIALETPRAVAGPIAPTFAPGRSAAGGCPAPAALTVPAIDRELARALPVPELAAPVAAVAGRDPRTAPLQSDHAVRYKRARSHPPSIQLPEPASIVLLATGAVGLLARRALRRGQL